MNPLSEQFNIVKKFIKCYAGQGDAASAREAVEAITPVAGQGDVRAQMLLGKYYSWGYHSGCDNLKAIHWFEKAADNGAPEAAQFIMEIYRNDCPDGIDAEQRKALILKWHRRWFDILEAKADKGSANAAKDLMCQYVEDCPEDMDPDDGLRNARKWYDRWIELLTAKADKGDSMDKAVARRWYKKDADLGEITAMLRLAECYKNGIGGKQDYAKAMDKYMELAERINGRGFKHQSAGIGTALYELGNMYLNGLGVSPDPKEAIHYFTLAVKKCNNPQAAEELKEVLL